jgi:hypothetical protein
VEFTAILFLILVPIASFQLNEPEKDQDLIDIEPSREYQDFKIRQKFKKDFDKEILEKIYEK